MKSGARALAPRRAQHHWPFVYVYLKLVSRFMGAATAKELKASFKKHGVRAKPKRTRNLTPEQREAAVARLAEARAKKQAVVEVPKQEIEPDFLPPFTD